MKIGGLLLASAIGLGTVTGASAKAITLNTLPTSLTVPTAQTFANSYKFSLGSSTDLDFSWSSKNLGFLGVVLYEKVGKSYVQEDVSTSLSGSFLSDLSKGHYVLDFLGVRSGGHHSSYTFSVMAVPEADTWAMLILGAGLIGYQLKRKHRLLPRQAISTT